jgi:hypothetical protein
MEHDFGVDAVSLQVKAEEKAGEVEVEATIHNDRVGHLFPSVDSNLRYAWVAISVMDDKGNVLLQTQPPPEGALYESETILFRCFDDDFGKHCDSTIAPLASRTLKLTLPIGERHAAEVRVAVFQLFDSQPLTEARTAVQ